MILTFLKCLGSVRIKSLKCNAKCTSNEKGRVKLYLSVLSQHF